MNEPKKTLHEVLKYLFLCLAGCMLFAFGVYIHDQRVQQMRSEIQTDTLLIRDTLRIAQPVARDSLVVRYVRVPVVRDSVQTDSVWVHDTLFVSLSITQKRYTDSLYTAWVSGYHPSLDSIYIHRPTIYIKTTEASPKREKRWQFGLQGGVGMTPKGVQPYVGVGVGYRIF